MINTIPHTLGKTAELYPDKQAVFTSNHSLTFSDLHGRALATAQVLRELGVTAGQRVGVLMGKGLEQVTAILGILYANAIFVPLHPVLTEYGIAHVVNDCGMSALITDSTRIPVLASHAGRLKLIIGRGQPTEGYPFLPQMIEAVGQSRSLFRCVGEDSAGIIYSSGSTGRAKGIVISHKNFFDGARIVSTYLKTTGDCRIASVLPLSFDYGLNQLWQTIYKGASLFLHEFLFPAALFELLEARRITALPLMPVLITKMFDERLPVGDRRYDVSSLRYISTTGGAVTPKMLTNLKRTFPASDIYLMYGLTEAFRSTYLEPSQVDKRPTSIGKAIPEVEIYVLAEKGDVCPPGVPGELVHRGGCVTKGYWNDPVRTAQRFRELPRFPGETVVFSGDIVKTDEEGYLYFISRKDAMIKRYGFRISPNEIEEVVSRHEAIATAVVFGVVNPDVGEDIVLVYTTTRRTPVDEEKLSLYLKKLLPYYMIPTYFLEMEAFPVTGNEGKIDRVAVRADGLSRLGLS